MSIQSKIEEIKVKRASLFLPKIEKILQYLEKIEKLLFVIMDKELKVIVWFGALFGMIMTSTKIMNQHLGLKNYGLNKIVV